MSLTNQPLIERIQESFGQEHVILYDGDCVYCERYVEFIRIREALGEVVMANLRDHADIVNALRLHNIEPNDGMVFVSGQNLYWGDQAVHALALLSSPSDWFNRVQKMVLSRRRLSEALYPVMKFVRGITLRFRGKTLIP